MTVVEKAITERLRWRADPEEFEAIRSLWIEHSKAEDARSLDGLIATLTPDCVYQVDSTSHRWEGHEGARRFYTELLTAFPDITFDLTDIVVGPQGVFEVADVRGTHRATWLGVEPDNQVHQWRTVIHFPWDRERRLFKGENIYPSGDAPGKA